MLQLIINPNPNSFNYLCFFNQIIYYHWWNLQRGNFPRGNFPVTDRCSHLFYFALHSEGDVQKIIDRTNKNKFDLNQNFPDKLRPVNPQLISETIAVMKWMKEYSFALCANMHGRSLVRPLPLVCANYYRFCVLRHHMA